MTSTVERLLKDSFSERSTRFTPANELNLDIVLLENLSLFSDHSLTPTELPRGEWAWKTTLNSTSQFEEYQIQIVKLQSESNPEYQVWIVHGANQAEDKFSFLWTEIGSWSITNAKSYSNLNDGQKQFLTTQLAARVLNFQDELREFRHRFHIPPVNHQDPNSKESIYLCGHSLGLAPKSARDAVTEFMDDWANLGVEGHFSATRRWVDVDERLLPHMAELIGAKPEEIAVMNGLSVNAHLMLVPFYQPTENRFKIVVESGAFPSDRYIVQSQLEFHKIPVSEGLIEIHPREGEDLVRTEDILQLIEEQGDSIALVFLCGIQYYTGQLFDIPTITAAGHKKGCRVGFDLAHAVGNVPLYLHDWNVDFAIWCNYKYMNGSAGAIAGSFVHGRLSGIPQENGKFEVAARDLPRFAGWWSQELSSRFRWNEPYDPQAGASGFRLSNPSAINCYILEESLKIFHEAGILRLRQKAEKVTGYLEFLLDNLCKAGSLKIITPRDPTQRGSQLSLFFTDGVDEIYNRLREGGVIADVRRPNVIRISPVPLYNSFSDVWAFVNIVRLVLDQN